MGDVPSTLQAAVIFALLISPGYVLLQGYRRARSYSVPDRDLYVLAQAVVASLAWLASIWFVLSVIGDPLAHWGLLPRDSHLLASHQAGVALLVLSVELVPFLVGLLAGSALNRLQGVERARGLLGWTGIFEPPTAWEQAWNEAAARVDPGGGLQAIDVSVRLKGGGLVRGRYGSSSRADLSPRPSHQIFLETAYGLDDSEVPARVVGDGTIGGVFIDASEIATIYFNS
jgi:hypothetical protein